MTKGAKFSDCRTWRYALWRQWDPCGTVLAVIGLNPSTADETKDDPTIRRCIRFAKDWGHGGLVMLNLFAYRATDPKVMKAFADPIGPGNDDALREYAQQSAMIIAAWGVHGSHLDRGWAVKSFVLKDRPLHCLGRTQDGFPRHPLYIRADAQPEVYRA